MNKIEIAVYTTGNNLLEALEKVNREKFAVVTSTSANAYDLVAVNDQICELEYSKLLRLANALQQAATRQEKKILAAKYAEARKSFDDYLEQQKALLLQRGQDPERARTTAVVVTNEVAKNGLPVVRLIPRETRVFVLDPKERELVEERLPSERGVWSMETDPDRGGCGGDGDEW